jgi:hypothetical protein
MAKSRSARRGLPVKWVLAAAGVFLAGLGGLLWWWLAPARGLTDELQYLPDNTRVIVSVKLGELLSTDLGIKMLAGGAFRQMNPRLAAMNPGPDFEAAIAWAVGVPPRQIARVTLGVTAANQYVVVVKTTAAVAAARLFRAIPGKFPAVQFSREAVGPYRLYHGLVGTPNEGQAFCVADEHTVLFGDSSTLRQVLQRGDDAGLSPAMQAAVNRADFSQTAVAVTDFHGLGETIEPVAAGRYFSRTPVLTRLTSQARTVVIEAEVGSQIDLTLRAWCGDARTAGVVKDQLTAFWEAMRNQVGDHLNLGNLDCTTEGEVVTAKVRVIQGKGAQQEAAEIDPRALNPLPGPVNLTGYPGPVGKVYWFKVTGDLGGSVWGTQVYTSDSTLAAAAVHAGVLKAGQTGVVKVQIVVGPAFYAGSTRNGVTSRSYGEWWAAYRFVR